MWLLTRKETLTLPADCSTKQGLRQDVHKMPLQYLLVFGLLHHKVQRSGAGSATDELFSSLCAVSISTARPVQGQLSLES